MTRCQGRLDEQTDLFIPNQPLAEGFAYHDDILSSEEEQKLLEKFKELPFKPFEFHGFLGNRRVVSFGWRYDYSGRELRASDPVPSFLLPFRDRAAAFAGVAPESIQQIGINEYAPNAGIGWHRDKPMFEDVIGISLGSACTLRLRRKQGDGWERVMQDVRPRSIYLLRGPARWLWEHSISPVDRLRYSVMFRNFTSQSPM